MEEQRDENDSARRACRVMLRPVVRMMLRCGIKFRDFSDIARSVYVEVAGRDYGLRGRPANHSRVAMLTGLSRRDVAREREVAQADDLEPERHIDRVSRVLSGWHQDAEFTRAPDHPRDLALEGPGGFQALCDRYAGDLPFTALLKELKHVKAVETTATGALRVLKRYYMPAQTDPAALTRAGDVLHDLGSTVQHNLAREPEQSSRFEGRATHAYVPRRAAAEFREYLEQRGQAFLEAVDQWLAERALRPDQAADQPCTRLGAGLYMIQDDHPSRRRGRARDAQPQARA